MAKNIDGKRIVTEMMQGLDAEAREKILKNVAARDPQLVEEIRKRLFVFEDLEKIGPKALQKLLRDLPQKTWAMALRGADPSFLERLLKHLSKTAAKILQDEIQALGRQKKEDVEAAKNEILEVAKKAGTIPTEEFK